MRAVYIVCTFCFKSLVCVARKKWGKDVELLANEEVPSRCGDAEHFCRVSADSYSKYSILHSLLLLVPPAIGRLHSVEGGVDDDLLE